MVVLPPYRFVVCKQPAKSLECLLENIESFKGMKQCLIQLSEIINYSSCKVEL